MLMSKITMTKYPEPFCVMSFVFEGFEGLEVEFEFEFDLTCDVGYFRVSQRFERRLRETKKLRNLQVPLK